MNFFSNISNIISNNNKLFNTALFFIEKSKKEGKGINNKKLQKLTYYAQAWNLAIFNKKIFNNNIEAWVNGPVVPELYRKYRSYGYIDITTNEKFEGNIFSQEELRILDDVYRVYGAYDSDYLVWLTHNERPWLEARGDLEESKISNNVIKEDIMKEFYSSKLKK